MYHFHRDVLAEKAENTDKVPRFHMTKPLQIIENLVVSATHLRVGRVGLDVEFSQRLMRVCDSVTDRIYRQRQTADFLHKLSPFPSFCFRGVLDAQFLEEQLPRIIFLQRCDPDSRRSE